MALTTGQVLKSGKYEYKILEPLGQGRFALTYKAQRTDISQVPPQPDGNLWVIKILNPKELRIWSRAERNRLETLFWNEASKLRECREIPHIVRAEQAFKAKDIICVPLAYVAGQSLAERPQQQLSEPIALDYIQQIGEAIAQVHASVGLVHRDIRPANIFLRIEGSRVEAVLTDFGLAMDFDTQVTRSRPNERMDGFSPLELYSCGRQPIGPYTDVYSLAATLYELLTGVTPPSAEDRKVNGVPVVPIQAQNSAVSAKTVAAIAKGLALEPHDRPASVTEWLKLLGIRQKRRFAIGVVNWDKWNVIWMAAGVIVAAVTALLGIPALVEQFQSEPESSGLIASGDRNEIQPTSPIGVNPSDIDHGLVGVEAGLPTSPFGDSSQEEIGALNNQQGG